MDENGQQSRAPANRVRVHLPELREMIRPGEPVRAETRELLERWAELWKDNGLYMRRRPLMLLAFFEHGAATRPVKDAIERQLWHLSPQPERAAKICEMMVCLAITKTIDEVYLGTTY